MKLLRSNRNCQAAFTLPELLVAITIFAFLTIAIVFAHLYGLSMYRINENTLTVTATARNAIGRMTDEIRTCGEVEIGNVSGGVFTGLLMGEVQRGGALQIKPSKTSSNYVVYFINTADQTFQRATSEPSSAVIVAESVTNTLVFQAQNHLGQVLTNNANNRVIHFTLEYFQPRRHRQVAEYYKLESSVTRRAD